MPTMPTMQSGRRKNPVTFSRYNVTQIYGQDYRCNANPKRSNKNIFDKVNPLTDPGGPGCEADLRSFVNVVSLSGGHGRVLPIAFAFARWALVAAVAEAQCTQLTNRFRALRSQMAETDQHKVIQALRAFTIDRFILVDGEPESESGPWSVMSKITHLLHAFVCTRWRAAKQEYPAY